MTYRVINLKGDYSSREYAANTAGAAMVWHQHFNSFNSTASYALVEIAYPVSDREMAVATEIAAGYNALIGGGLGSGDGVKVLSNGDRAEYIIDGNKEAYISEPLFLSNASQAAWIVQDENLRAIAKINVDVIKRHYPDGSTIALSVGHKYKTSNPSDRGAAVSGYPGIMEADLNEKVINFMTEMLADGVIPTPTPVPVPAPSPYPTLRYGSRGNAVKTLQTRLNAWGAKLVVDGIWGNRTDVAVRTFQKNHGLTVDGIVGPATWSHLKEAPSVAPTPAPAMPVVKYGMKGSSVRVLQQHLVLWGHSVVVDGIFGYKTLTAVKSFQSRHGLVVDGIVGAKTWGVLLQR
jgi:peptidoglycan hydrolase-like protein with peptidoglycan-binding domain